MPKENAIESLSDVFETTNEVEPSIEVAGMKAKAELAKVIPVLAEQKAAIEAEIVALELKRDAVTEKLRRAEHEVEFIGSTINLSNWRRMNNLKTSGRMANEHIKEMNSALEENGLGEFAIPLLDEVAFPE